MSSIKLSTNQIYFISKKTEIEDPQQAIEYLAELMIKEKIHPSKMPDYVNRLMEKDRKKIK